MHDSERHNVHAMTSFTNSRPRYVQPSNMGPEPVGSFWYKLAARTCVFLEEHDRPKAPSRTRT